MAAEDGPANQNRIIIIPVIITGESRSTGPMTQLAKTVVMGTLMNGARDGAGRAALRVE